MLIIDKKILMFDIKNIYFSDYPYDIKDCDYLNFHYCKNKVKLDGFNCKKELTIVIDLTKDLETIWNNIDKNIRYEIKRAQRDGIKIFRNQGYEIFYKIYRSFIQKKGLKSYFDFFGFGSTDLDSMKKNGTLFVAEYNGEILAGTLVLEGDFCIESWLGATKRFEAKNNAEKRLIARADRLIDWEIIKYAKEKGLREFDLGGIWSEEEADKDITKKGINEYKSRMGGEVVTRYSYQKFYSKTCNLAFNMYDLKNLGNKYRLNRC